MDLTRRQFIQTTATAAAGAMFAPSLCAASNAEMNPADLPKGNAPAPVPFSHFPSRLHAFVWRNWSLVPLERMAEVVGTTRKQLLVVGRSMGLPEPPRLTRDQQRRSYLTVIKRNWHLLPYEQLLGLLGWTPEQMAYTLREDDFFYHKLGEHKPACEPLRFATPDPEAAARAADIARLVKERFPQGLDFEGEPLFQFVSDLSARPAHARSARAARGLSPRFCYSYFALYGDPLLEADLDPYPENYLARLAAAGVDGVWLQAVLYKLAKFPWDEQLSVQFEERLGNLRKLVTRARKHGIGIWLYLNEPRSMPLAFYDGRPELKGVVEKDRAALCTSHPDVQRYLSRSIESICRAVPDLAGFFTITASENLTSCWSHHHGADCPRCAKRTPAQVIAEVNGVIQQGIESAGARQRLLAWDWGWGDQWAADAIRALPPKVTLMSVSEWNLPLERGGIKSAVGEYSISAVGPGPRAAKHWEVARQRGLKTIAKIQAGNTWELSAMPYIPAVANVARHAANLRTEHLDGIMLGWTLGGWPSPNLEVVATLSEAPGLTPEQAMLRVAENRYGKFIAPAVVQAWQEYSAAFSHLPFSGSSVYFPPFQLGPANLLWAEPTGYHATMVGFPYDDLDRWRGSYPADVFLQQMEKVAAGFNKAHAALAQAAGFEMNALPKSGSLSREQANLVGELIVGKATGIHFQSVGCQCQFVATRRKLESEKDAAARAGMAAEMDRILETEEQLAAQLARLQARDSRLGFEASNQYYYVPLDLVEKVINCAHLRGHWR